MRLLVTLGLVVIAAASAFAAQSATLTAQLQQIERGGGQSPHSVSRPAPQPPPPPPPAPPSVVAPPITYPFPPLMPAPRGGLTPRVGEGPPFQTFTPIFNPSGSPYYPPYVGGHGGYLDMTQYDWRKRFARTAPQPLPAATGLLRLAVTPLTAQVFVDSLYAGTVEEINAQNVIQLEAGPHRIEIRAAGYETLTVDIRIPPYETITYRAALDAARVAPPARSPAGAASPTSMYVIPNCYLGNIPPRPNRLPSGCDIKQLQVLAPK